MTKNNEQRIAKQARVDSANQVLLAMATYGRRIFYSKESGQVSRFSLGTNGVIWLTDARTGALVYVASTREWRGFSFDAPARQLVEDLCRYIRTAEPIAANWFESWPGRAGNEDLWRYGPAAMAAVRTTLATCVAIGAGEVERLAA